VTAQTTSLPGNWQESW